MTVKLQSDADLLFSRDVIAIKKPIHISGWNTSNGTFKLTGSLKRKFYKPRRNSRRQLEYEAVSNPAPDNKLIIMCLFH